MAAGAGFTDSRGIYKYGESDSIGTLFSDFMNLGQTSTSDAIAADRSRLTTLETSVANPSYFVAASAAAVTAKFGNPDSMTATQRKTLQDLGILVYRTDLGTTERFLALYNSSTNTIGAAAYGYYPVHGGAGTVLTRSGTGLSIPTATQTVLTFNTFASNGVTLNSTTTPSTFTTLYAGWYRLHSDAGPQGWSSTAGTARTLTVNKNSTSPGTNQLGTGLVSSSFASLASYGVDLTVDVKLAVGDVIRFWIYQDSGSTATHNATNATIEFLRPAQV